ncbi:MAG: hypothetical protein ABI641_08695 [Caldimonas sp.]
MHESSPTGRIVNAAFGLLFVVIAIVIAATTYRSMLARGLVAALVIGALGIDALVSAARGTRSWLSRIGPLP